MYVHLLDHFKRFTFIFSWLPPPVMKVLGDKSIEAVKRASIIATALGWLVNHIPTAGLPIELVAVLTVAKALVPIIGELQRRF